MSILREIALDDVLADLPDIEPLDLARLPDPALRSVFLCAQGFERRSLEVTTLFAKWPLRVSRAIVFEYRTNQTDNFANRTTLLSQLKQFSTDVQTIEIDVDDFSERLRENLTSQLSSNEKVSVFFDISGAANRLLMKCLRVLLDCNVDLTVFYAEADHYWPSKKEYTEWAATTSKEPNQSFDWGVGSVDFSRDFPGVHFEQLPDCLLVFPSFNKERARAVVSAVDPSLLQQPGDKVLWLLGRPHSPLNEWRIDAMRQLNGLDESDKSYIVSTFDYKEALRVLNRIYLERAGAFRLTLAPMGSKLQAVASSLFCFLYPDVRVVFATPKMYNAAQYSGQCSATWMIRFGSVDALIASLNRIGTMTLEGG